MSSELHQPKKLSELAKEKVKLTPSNSKLRISRMMIDLDSKSRYDRVQSLSRLTSVAGCGTEFIQMIISDERIVSIMNMLQSRQFSIRLAAMKLVKVLTSGTIDQIQILLDQNLCDRIQGSIINAPRDVRRCGLECLHNVVLNGTNQQIQGMIISRVLDRFVEGFSIEDKEFNRKTVNIFYKIIEVAKDEQVKIILNTHAAAKLYFCSKFQDEISKTALDALSTLFFKSQRLLAIATS